MLPPGHIELDSRAFDQPSSRHFTPVAEGLERGRLLRFSFLPRTLLEVHLRGQGPRGYGSAAHGLPACESRDAGRAPPWSF
jgi:hypothetical protein